MSSEDILGGGKRKKKKKKVGRALSPALKKMAARSLDVDDDDIRGYMPTELDLQIAEAMVQGQNSFKDIAEHIGCDPANISRVMKDPTRCAWLAKQLHRIVSKRMGLVDLALMQQALGGNIAAIKLYYERFGELIHRSQVTVARIDFDPSKLTDADLDTILRSEAAGTDVVIEGTAVPGKPAPPPPTKD